jgi:predicted amidophosphoribosyltransferase
MILACEYCRGATETGTTNCKNCGAPLPVTRSTPLNTSLCPFCGRKLLALGSPSCSYCGRRLPEEFIKTRTGELHRINELNPLPSPDAVLLSHHSKRQN